MTAAPGNSAPAPSGAPALSTALAEARRSLAALAPVAGGGEDQPLVRACTLNLVALCTTLVDARRMGRAAVAVSGRHPSRAVVVRYLPRRARPEFSTAVTGHCRISLRGERQVCCELVEVTAAGSIAVHLGTLLDHLQTPDLPLYAWWSGPLPVEDATLQAIFFGADFLLVDSAVSPDPLAALLWTVRVPRGPGAVPVVSDLAWHRLHGWRRAVPAVFDTPRPGFEASRITKITVRDPGPRPPAEALLLAAWMASFLGWIPREVEPGGRSWTLRRDSRTTRVVFDPAGGGAASGEIASVTVHSGHQVLTVDGRHHDPHSLCRPLQPGKTSAAGTTGFFPPPSTRDLLCRVLDTAPEDAALNRTRALLGALPG